MTDSHGIGSLSGGVPFNLDVGTESQRPATFREEAQELGLPAVCIWLASGTPNLRRRLDSSWVSGIFWWRYFTYLDLV